MSDENEDFKPVTRKAYKSATEEFLESDPNELAEQLEEQFEELEEEALKNGNVENTPQDEQEPILTAVKGEYLYIFDSKDEIFYTVRALKDFEVLDKGPSPWDLVSSLESDGFVEILPDPDSMDCIDFAWEY